MEHLYTMIIGITYNFISRKTSFYVIINPTCPIYILHILHGHPSGTHLWILNLKSLKDSESCIKPKIFDQDRTPIQCYLRQNLDEMKMI